MIGETVSVVFRAKAKDALNNDVYTDVETVEYADVLVNEQPSSAINNDARMDSIRSFYRLAFPKGTDISRFDECEFVVRGMRCVFVSKRQHVTNCPTRWDNLIEVANYDG